MNKTTREIWLIRHGESTANAGAVTEDHTIIPLTEKGHNQAKEVSKIIPHTPSQIIISPYLRAVQTALPTLIRFPDVPHQTWEDTREFTYLDPSTCINTSSADRRGRVSAYWEHLDQDYIDGPGAESFSMFITRTKAFIVSLANLPPGLTLVFTHAQFIQAAQALKTTQYSPEILMQDFRDLPHIKNCEIIKWEE